MGNAIQIVIGADASEVNSAVKQVTEALNDAEKTAAAQRRHAEAIAGLHRRLADTARQQRRERWELLSVEERIAKLKERQATVEARLAREGDNRLRRTALMLRNQQINVELRELGAQAESNRQAAWVKGMQNAAAQRTLQGQGMGELLRSVLNASGFGHLVSRFDQASGLLANIAKSGLLRSVGLAGGTIAAGVGAIYYGRKAQKENEAYVSDVEAMARRTGLSNRQAQAVMYGARMAPGGVEQFLGLLDDLRMNIGQALLNRSGAEAKGFERLGVSLADLERNNYLDVLMKISAALERGGHNARDFSTAGALLGRSFKELGPELDRIVARMARFSVRGMGMSDETISGVSESKRWWQEIGEIWSEKLREVRTANGEMYSKIANSMMLSYGGGFISKERQQRLLEIIGSQRGPLDIVMGNAGVDISGREAVRLEQRLLERQAAKQEKAGAPVFGVDDYALSEAAEWYDAYQKHLAAKPRGTQFAAGYERGDTLARIGLYRGAAGSEVGRIASEQLRRLEDIVRELKELRRWEQEEY